MCGAIQPTPPNQPKTSLRAKLEAHRHNADCAACHRKIDPLGLAFDNYDAIGRWRTEEAVRDGAGTNPKIDASGELPDGRKFADAVGLKKLMLDDVDKFAAAFSEKLATYAMRRRHDVHRSGRIETPRRAIESRRLPPRLPHRIIRGAATCF